MKGENHMDETKYVFCIIGMSGVGKDTIKYRLLEINSNLTELIQLKNIKPIPT
jgi:guanylate kinase